MKTVRNGQKVWPYCEECGCRLEVISNHYYRHWYGEIKVIDDIKHTLEIISDARGCRCSQLLDFGCLMEPIYG